MKKVLVGALVTACAIAFSVPVMAKTATVKGTVVDEGCSLKEMADHKADPKAAAEMEQCAIDCAKRGEPLALLTADGKVFRIAGGLAANKNAKLIAHMNHTVEITGDVIEKDGKVQIVADTLKPMK